MLYREAGQFKTSYAADQQLFPIRQDRIGVLLLLAVAFVGVPLLAGLGIARNVLGNRALVADVSEAAEAVKNGAGLASSLGRNGRFPRLALQMIQVGEESGTLESMLLKTADTFEQESARAIDRMLAALVPVITLLLASVVGVVIIAVLVPLYDLTNAIG